MSVVNVSVGGLWRTSVYVTADTTWAHLKLLIRDKTAVLIPYQRLIPGGERDSAACGLGGGDEVMCEWRKLPSGRHPLHYTGCPPLHAVGVTAHVAALHCAPPVCGDAGVYENVDAVRSWVASGADINVVDDGGYTPLMEASHCQYAECVAEMLRLGADARRADNSGKTALHWVASRFLVGGAGAEVVQLLVAAGCDAAVRDNDGHTAVELARLECGADWGRVVERWVQAAMA